MVLILKRFVQKARPSRGRRVPRALTNLPCLVGLNPAPFCFPSWCCLFGHSFGHEVDLNRPLQRGIQKLSDKLRWQWPIIPRYALTAESTARFWTKPVPIDRFVLTGMRKHFVCHNNPSGVIFQLQPCFTFALCCIVYLQCKQCHNQWPTLQSTPPQLPLLCKIPRGGRIGRTLSDL